MKNLLAVTAAMALLGLGITAQAVTIDTVTVGDAGNAADTTGYGSVAYTYNIGKYEVTAGQYTAFLNAVAKTDTDGLYNTNMDTAVSFYGCNIKRSGEAGSYIYSVASDWANRPVNYVSFWDSCRFANWQGNGQKTGAQDVTTTEDGAYTLDGYTGTDGRTIQRNANWKWAVTSEDEWYKAAYYKGGGTNAGYWLYPTQSDSAPSNQLVNPTNSGNNATYYNNGYTIGSPYYRTEVGAHEKSDSAYGTFDQGGNVWEWNEAIRYQDQTHAYRFVRGGSFDFTRSTILQSTFRYYYDGPYSVELDAGVGFRVVQAVPEPSTILVLLSGLGGALGLLGRCRHQK